MGQGLESNIRVSMLSVLVIVRMKVRVDSNTDGNHTRFVGIGARVVEYGYDSH